MIHDRLAMKISSYSDVLPQTAITINNRYNSSAIDYIDLEFINLHANHIVVRILKEFSNHFHVLFLDIGCSSNRDLMNVDSLINPLACSKW
jgi:hypothetical protein